MAILDIFKKKPKEKPVEKEVKPLELTSRRDKISSPPLHYHSGKERKQVFNETYRILKVPHITEKATDLTEKNQYIFRIFPRAKKMEVKKAVEGTYGVDVVSIKIINVPEKKRRLGRIQGIRPGYKKAIVKIKRGQKIEVLPR